MDADQINYNWEEIMVDGILPGDVMVSILSNLHVKSLLRFKAVCRSWHSLISSPIFITMHLRRQSNNLLVKCNGELTFVSHNYSTKKAFDFDDLFSEYFCHHLKEEKPVNFVGSCKGLVCIQVYGFCKTCFVSGSSERFILWNPATRRYRSIEIPNKGYGIGFSVIGLGYVEATNDYKIVGLGRACGLERHLIVYNLSSDSWKEVDYDANSLPTASLPPTFMNGCMHWLLRTSPCVDCTCSRSVSKMFAFDVEDEVMSCFCVPYNHSPDDDSYYILLEQPLVISGCLSIAFHQVMEDGIEIWVMVEYGVEGSWVKQFTIQGLTAVAMMTPLISWKVPFISWKDSEILFIYMEEEEDPEEGLQKLMFYDPCSKNLIFLEDGFYCKKSFQFQVLHYVESLASVMGGRNLGHRTEDCTLRATAPNSSTAPPDTTPVPPIPTADTPFGPWMLASPRRRRRRAPPKSTEIGIMHEDNTTVLRSYSIPVSPTRDGNNSGSRFNILADLHDVAAEDQSI